ncbi:hypothetical protein E1193_00430 [Micromonospora sp. KC606]|uniref:hypothetical protein n=1 Tax=Micromonospora sp. KC606 TaxID=2530379 RepID=UPI001052AB8A|nr:hypothetical protein [Micromonospora sp. KC606]TDC86167.1 hypothetical protein E1193_00430 [Micromonospora sp. KC606]
MPALRRAQLCLLRYRGIAARARCGFATYFQPGQGVDHWIAEYRRDGRWVRIDAESWAIPSLRNPKTSPPTSSSPAVRRGRLSGSGVQIRQRGTACCPQRLPAFAGSRW